MATKKSAAKSSGTEAAPSKTTAAKKAPAKTAATAETAAESKTAASRKSGGAKSAQSPSHEEISLHAYILWERDGRQHGRHEHYWQQAERELSGR